MTITKVVRYFGLADLGQPVLAQEAVTLHQEPAQVPLAAAVDSLGQLAARHRDSQERLAHDLVQE